jgi:uncharacterized protein YecE (DUF72 family)
MNAVRIGTCSWTDKTMVKAWYPSGVSSAEDRLRFYAARFDTVEADSPFYALPQQRITELWAARTPPGFLFHVKAYGMMTQHSVDVRTLPPQLMGFEHDVTERGRVMRPHPDMVDAAFDMFLDAMRPLKAAGKLGGILMQFPPYFAATDPQHTHRNLDYLDYVRGKLVGHHVLVEFRHPSWVTGPQMHQTLEFLDQRGLDYVSVDAPQFPGKTTMPPLATTTGEWAYVRFHGRNRDTYFARTETAADRFDYLYTDEELEEWDTRIRSLASEAKQTFVMFNNCRNDYAPKNASQLAMILGDIVAEPYSSR